MTPFPILRLPYVALVKVFNQFSLTELFFLSLCSVNVYGFIQKINKNKTFDIAIHFDKRIYVEAKRGDYLTRMELVLDKGLPSRDKYILKKIGNQCFAIEMSENGLSLYFLDWFRGVTAITVCLQVLFTSPITSVWTGSSRYPDGPQKIIDWILEDQNIINDCYIECDQTTDTGLEYVLAKANHFQNLILDTNATQEFRQDYFEFEGNSLKIEKGHWFSLNNFLNLNPRELFVNGTRLTSEDINVFLKHWINNGNSKTSRIDIELISPINLDELFSELNVIYPEDNVKRTFIGDNGLEIPFFGGFDLKRSDGLTATIIHSEEDTENTHFKMVVWQYATRRKVHI